VEHVSNRAMIMYLGRVVETAGVEDVFRRPNHPYTQALLAEIPRLTHRRKTFAAIKGEIPSPLKPPGGCHFHPRCPHVTARCKTERPVLREIETGHLSACHLNDR
jgi:peptide/nickel transport system ATP-binding protein